MRAKYTWVLVSLMLAAFTELNAQYIHFETIYGTVNTELLSSVQNLTFPENTVEIKFFESPNLSYNLLSLKKIYFNLETGVNADLARGSEIEIYPNPVTKTLVVRNLSGKDTEVEIYSVYGEKMATKKGCAEDPQLDVGNLTSGLYLVKVNGQTLKFVKQ
jgi:hypothetical protein